MKPVEAFIKFNEDSKHLWLPSKIETVDLSEITELEFMKRYVARNIPVVIRNAFNHWEALKWNKEYLSSKIKHPVTVAITPNGYSDSIQNGKFVLPYEQKMTLDEFYRYETNIPYVQFQNSSLNVEFPQLVSDAPSLEFFNKVFGDLDATNLWVGDSRSVSSLHKDPYENIYCVVSGEKEFVLLPPSDTPFLYKQFYPVYKYNSNMQLEDQNYSIPWVPVDPEDPTGYPLFQHCNALSVKVKPGELLYLPALWYHKVKQSDSTIAVNFWYDMQYDSRFNFLQLQEDLLN
ncbi:hypothetical protein HDV04_005163 [Boothiomyces sp. JEL0838]|nr:hypothetical protein HDV04_005163 [Boothiomyces sp. JEL0838]